MARKGNPISVRLDLNRSSDSSRFSEGDRESHRMGQSFPSKGVGGRCRCPGRTRLLLRLEDHWKTPGTRACRERSTLGGRASTVSPGHNVNLRSYFGSIRPPTRLTFGFRLGRCIILHFPKRTFIHFFLPRRPRRLKRREKSRPGKEKGRWWAFGEVGPIGSTSEKKCLAEAKKRLTHFIRQANDLRFAGTTKTTISLFPFFGATFFFPRDGVGVYNNLFFEDAREQLLGQLRIKCWNLLGKDKVMELIEKFIDLGGIGELIRGIEMMIEIILRNRRIPYGYNSYLNEVKKMRSLLSNRTNTNTLIESVKIKSVYQSASPIAQDISFQPRNKTRSFRSILSKIVKDIPLVMKKGVEGIRICCSGRSEGAEIARTECGKYGKTSRNVFNQKIDYAPAEVSTRYGISGVKVWISYSKKKGGRAISETCSRGCKPDGTQLGFGRYGTKSCRAGRLSYRAIEAARRAIIGQFHRAMSGQFRRNGKIWVRVLADLPITGKPTEVRMGRGKGNPTGWIARVSTGQILFEMDGVSLSNARQAATLAAHKPCSSTKFVQWS
ncbi:hypothetical protein ACSBR1_043930 (mitochondrion) [Camellia fascicularis]